MSCTKAPKLQGYIPLYFYVLVTDVYFRVGKMVDKFLDLYTPNLTQWSTIEDFGAKLGFSNLVSQTGESFMLSQGIGELYTHELLEAVTRVNYGQVS